MTRHFLRFASWSLVFLVLCLRAPRADVVAGRFGSALRGTRGEPGPSAEPNAAYNSNPLTVECWAKLNSKSGFNILVANETKTSPTHWEIYSYANSGFFSAYFPGYMPSEVISNKDITDGNWHYLAMVREGNTVRLYVDAVKVKEVALTAPPSLKGQPGRLAFGSLVEGGIGCDGLVDEVRISRVARRCDSVPTSPFASDADTVGLWHFDPLNVGAARPCQPSHTEDCFPDSSALHNCAKILPASVAAAEAEKQWPYQRPSLVVLPPKPDLAVTRQLLKRALSELRLPTLKDADETRDGVLEDWEEQFFHLSNQLSGREKLFPGAAEQVLDRQALVWETDGDPLGVVLRRTTALVRLLTELNSVSKATKPAESRLHHAGESLAPFEHDLIALKSASAKIDLKDTEKRKAYYLAACALRRRIAFVNPLLNFDRILFVARGNYQGSRWTGPAVTGDAFGQHFATQYFAFNSIPRGGLFIVKNFKTKPEIVNVVKDSIVENGRLKGRKLEGGAFLSPDLSYDGKTILFAWTETQPAKRVRVATLALR